MLRTCYSNTTATHIRIYQIRHTAYKKTAPEEGLIQPETCRAYIEKIKTNHKNSVQLVHIAI